MAQTQTHTDESVRARHQARGTRPSQLSHYLFVVPALLYILLTTIYPIVSNLRMSFYDVTVTTFLSNNAPFVGLGNYQKVLNDPAFQHALRLSLLFTGGSLLFQFTIGFALALPGAEIRGVNFELNTLVVASRALLVGSQSVLFAIGAKTFAIREGLMPPDSRVTRFYQRFSVERGTMVGLQHRGVVHEGRVVHLHLGREVVEHRPALAA
jgi:ABC-type polysaccharide transport system permease subunit